MIQARPTEDNISDEIWRLNADRIADWQILRMVNRTDQATYWTGNGWIASPGDVADRLRVNCERLAPTVCYTHNADGLCKWVCLDFDNHDSDPAVAQRNMDTATGIMNTLTELHIVCALEDSDGQGGLHLGCCSIHQSRLTVHIDSQSSCAAIIRASISSVTQSSGQRQNGATVYACRDIITSVNTYRDSGATVNGWTQKSQSG